MPVFKEVGHDAAHDIVSKNPSLYWDGWDIIEWKKYDDAIFQKNGAFRNGKWGKCFRMPVSNNGTWKVPAKYVMDK